MKKLIEIFSRKHFLVHYVSTNTHGAMDFGLTLATEGWPMRNPPRISNY